MDSLFDDSEVMPTHIHIAEIIRLYRISGSELKDLIYTIEPSTISVGPNFMVPYKLFQIICAICEHDELSRRIK